MAATVSESVSLPTTMYPVDLYFDLDIALTTFDGQATDAPSLDSSVSAMPSDLSTAGICTVCLEELRPGSGAKRMPCCHVYHGSCISTWLALDRSCPLCRSPINFSAEC